MTAPAPLPLTDEELVTVRRLLAKGMSLDEDLQERLLATIDARTAQMAVLVQIAKGLDDDDRDYERINNLAGCENNHWRTQLREIMKDLPAAARELMQEVERLRGNQRTAGGEPF